MGNYRLQGGKVIMQEAEIPVLWEGDVAVAGGGPGGLGAVIAAAKNGKKAIIVEKYGFLGGMCSYGAGMPLGGAYPAYRTIGGISEDFLHTIANSGLDSADIRDKTYFGYWYFHDSEFFRHVAFEKVQNAGADFLMHTMVVDVIMEDRKIIGLIVECKTGRRAILAKMIVDATGDGDVSAWSGADFVVGRDNDNAVMAVTIPYIVANVDIDKLTAYYKTDPHFAKAKQKAQEAGIEISDEDALRSWHKGMRPNTLFSNMIRVREVNATDVIALSKAEAEARKRMVKHMEMFRRFVPGFEFAYITQSGEQIGIRDSRRIIGESTLTTRQCLEMRKTDDVILRCGGPIDDASRGKGESSQVTPVPTNDWYDVPYGVIVVKNVDNLFVSGRCFSSEYKAHAGTRGMALLLGMGEAAGTAAAIAIDSNVMPKNVDIKKLQDILTKQGVDLGLDVPRGIGKKAASFDETVGLN